MTKDIYSIKCQCRQKQHFIAVQASWTLKQSIRQKCDIIKKQNEYNSKYIQCMQSTVQFKYMQCMQGTVQFKVHSIYAYYKSTGGLVTLLNHKFHVILFGYN